MKISVAEAKNKLPKLIKKAENGERVTICRRGKPVADLVRTAKPTGKKSELGVLKGKKIVLDTVAFLFAIGDPASLSRKARTVMGDPANQRELSVISLAEIAMKNAAGKLNLSREDAMDALS